MLVDGDDEVLSADKLRSKDDRGLIKLVIDECKVTIGYLVSYVIEI